MLDPVFIEAWLLVEGGTNRRLNLFQFYSKSKLRVLSYLRSCNSDIDEPAYRAASIHAVYRHGSYSQITSLIRV